MFCPVCRADYPADYKVCPKDATHLLASPRIGKYQIDALLGVGGMGAVYRAVNPDTKAQVAIKLMNPSVAGAEAARARFQREAAAVAALRTTHVVKVYDFGTEADGTLYLVMELLDGHTLRDEIRAAPERMDLARVQMVIDGALKGLAAAHRAGIVHRDLKPDNVFVADTDDGEVPKLLDFGIARVTATDADLTRTGALLGTAAYMAAEQVSASAGEVGPWSDVHAMGTILYEMLAGTPAFGGGSLTEVLHRVLQADAVPLNRLRPDLPVAIYDLVERCTSLDPAKRPRDAEAMRAELSAAQLVPPGTRIPPSPKTEPAQAQLGTAPTEAREASAPALAATAVAATAVAAPADGATSSMRAPASRAQAHRSKAALDDTLEASTAGSSRAVGGGTPPVRSRSKWPLLLGALVVAGGGLVALRGLRAPAATTRPSAAAVAIVHPVDAAPAFEPSAPRVVDAAPVDAAPVDAAPVDAAPVDAAPAACDAQALRIDARAATKARDYPRAIELATRGLTCGGHEPGLHAAIVFAACKVGDDKLVMKHYYSVSRLRIEAARSICARQGVRIP